MLNATETKTTVKYMQIESFNSITTTFLLDHKTSHGFKNKLTNSGSPIWLLTISLGDIKITFMLEFIHRRHREHNSHHFEESLAIR